MLPNTETGTDLVTLYKTTKSASRIWKAEVVGNLLIIQHGAVNGLLQTDNIHHKSSADAVKDKESRISHKILREGYSLDPNSPSPGKPMLLHNFRDYGNKLPTDIFHEPKLDGHRCIATKYTMASRNNDLITSMPHIAEELHQLDEHTTLDGEIYLHGASLQYHSSMIRSHVPGFGHHEFKYVVFDIQNSARYYIRRQLLIDLFNQYDFKHIQLLESTPGKRMAAHSYMQQYRALGYEGAIIRSPQGYYEKDSRSYSVQKVKQTLFARYPVVNIVCSDKGREKGLAIVECATPEGKTFRARIAKSEDIRRFIYENRSTFLPAGADIEFSDFTEAGIPQHPRCTQIYKGMKLAKATEVQNI